MLPMSPFTGHGVAHNSVTRMSDRPGFPGCPLNPTGDPKYPSHVP
jgi:hypothetical protein